MEQHAGPRGPGECLTEDQVWSYLAGGEGSLSRPALEHVEGCSRCRILLGEAAQARLGPPLAAARHTLGIGELVVDRYEIVRFLARGGMGEVYEARDRVLRERVALKTLLLASLEDERSFTRLRAEVLLARRVTHPNVCRILEFAVHRKRHGAQPEEAIPLLTMEFLEGETLAQRLRRGPLRMAEALPIVRQLAAGVTAIHDAGIVHRDLKPDNVFLCAGRESPRVVVMDFGLARPMDLQRSLSLSQTGTAAGTLDYMSPEQLRGASPSIAFDVYALGVMLFEMLAGRRPFEGPSSLAAALARVERDAPTLSSVVPGVDATWEAVVARCLERDPTARFPTIAAALAALEGDARAVRPPRRRRAARWLALGAATLGLAAAGLVIQRGRERGAPHGSGPGTVFVLPAEAPRLTPEPRPFASLPARVFCLSRLPDGQLGVVWGEPRRAERVDPLTGARTPWPLPAAALAEPPPSDMPDPLWTDCPQPSPDGRALLYVSSDSLGRRGVYLHTPGSGPDVLLAHGEQPAWHPSGDLVALRLDDTHVGLYNRVTSRLMVLPTPELLRDSKVLESAFSADGTQIAVRLFDSGARYSVGIYDVASTAFREQFSVSLAGSSHPTPLWLGGFETGALFAHVTARDGTLALAWLDTGSRTIRWQGHLAPLDISRAVFLDGERLAVVARHWTSDLELLEDERVVRTLRTELRAFYPEADSHGNVLVQMRDGDQFAIGFIPADGGPPRRVGPAALAASPSFTPDEKEMLCVLVDRVRKLDHVLRCGLPGPCRTLATLTSVDAPALSPREDRLAYLSWFPELRVEVLTLATGERRAISGSRDCRPRWRGDRLWVARAGAERFDWVEFDAATGQATGQSVPGRGTCEAESPGPERVLETRVRVRQRETSDLLAIPRPGQP